MKLGMSLKSGGKQAWNDNFELVGDSAVLIWLETILLLNACNGSLNFFSQTGIPEESQNSRMVR